MRDYYIGLDPGTAFGWALLADDGHRLASGVWDLKPRRHEGGGMRWVRLERYLRTLIGDRPELVTVGYEEVARHRGVAAAHLYGGAVAVVQRVCESLSVPYVGVPVGTVKRKATGKGNADKAAMVEAAVAEWACDDVWTPTHDEADALWVAECVRVGV